MFYYGGLIIKSKNSFFERVSYVHSINILLKSRYMDCVDELIFKVIIVPIKRMKIEYV